MHRPRCISHSRVCIFPLAWPDCGPQFGLWVIWLGLALLPKFAGSRVIDNDCSRCGEFSGCACTLRRTQPNLGVCVGGTYAIALAWNVVFAIVSGPGLKAPGRRFKCGPCVHCALRFPTNQSYPTWWSGSEKCKFRFRIDRVKRVRGTTRRG